MAVEGDFVAYDADLLVDGVCFGAVDPGIGDMGQDFFGEVSLVNLVDRLFGVECYFFLVAEVAICFVFEGLTVDIE